jgi:hypothetical protein
VQLGVEVLLALVTLLLTKSSGSVGSSQASFDLATS